jgi:hypothetical protein
MIVDGKNNHNNPLDNPQIGILGFAFMGCKYCDCRRRMNASFSSKENISLASAPDFLHLLLHTAITNLMVMHSCDLLRYDEGSLGLMSYVDEISGQCTRFAAIEDQSLRAARTAAIAAFGFGLAFMCLASIHAFLYEFSSKDIMLTMIGMCIQLCLVVVYVAKDNSLCDIEGCSWGSAMIWLVFSQITYLGALVGSFYIGDFHLPKQPTLSSLSQNKRKSMRRSLQMMERGALDVEYLQNYQ